MRGLVMSIYMSLAASPSCYLITPENFDSYLVSANNSLQSLRGRITCDANLQNLKHSISCLCTSLEDKYKNLDYSNSNSMDFLNRLSSKMDNTQRIAENTTSREVISSRVEKIAAFLTNLNRSIKVICLTDSSLCSSEKFLDDLMSWLKAVTRASRSKQKV